MRCPGFTISALSTIVACQIWQVCVDDGDDARVSIIAVEPVERRISMGAASHPDRSAGGTLGHRAYQHQQATQHLPARWLLLLARLRNVPLPVVSSSVPPITASSMAPERTAAPGWPPCRCASRTPLYPRTRPCASTRRSVAFPPLTRAGGPSSGIFIVDHLHISRN